MEKFRVTLFTAGGSTSLDVWANDRRELEQQYRTAIENEETFIRHSNDTSVTNIIVDGVLFFNIESIPTVVTEDEVLSWEDSIQEHLKGEPADEKSN